MGTGSSDLSIDINIADALRHAMLLYGDDVLEHPELVNILADHGAFKGRIGVDGIIQMLVDNGRIPSLLSLSYKKSAEIVSGVDKVVCELKYVSSFSERDIRGVILSLMKGMNMNPNLINDEKPDADLPDVTEIAPGYIELPSCCAVKPVKNSTRQDTGPDVEFSMGKYTGIKRNHGKSYTALLGLAAVIAIGLFAAANFTGSKKEVVPSQATESVSDRVYREILEDIHIHNGNLSPEGREKLNSALSENPDDYWLNLLKDKTR